MVDADQMARAERCLRLPFPEVGHPTGCSRQPTTMKTQECSGRYIRCADKAARHLSQHKSSRRPDRAILMVAFASGGRRRSEIAGLRRISSPSSRRSSLKVRLPSCRFRSILAVPRPASLSTGRPSAPMFRKHPEGRYRALPPSARRAVLSSASARRSNL